MKRNILIVVFSLLAYLVVDAQTYNNAIGLRVGEGIGLTFQQRVGNKFTLEGILKNQFKKENLKLTVLGRQHFPILFKRFNVYTGGGLHHTWYTGNDPEIIAQGNPYGVTLVGGAEISFGRFNVSYDYQPAFNVSGGDKAITHDTAISLRYIITKRPTKLDKWKKERKKKKEKKKKEKEKKKEEDDRNLWEKTKDIFK